VDPEAGLETLKQQRVPRSYRELNLNFVSTTLNLAPLKSGLFHSSPYTVKTSLFMLEGV
jgi:hypothetical protein